MLFDLKRVEFDYAKELPHLFDKVVTERDEAIRTLEKLVDTMHERREAIDRLGIIGSLSRRGTSGLEEYNAKTGPFSWLQCLQHRTSLLGPSSA